jgi:hypothetical protein
LRQDEHLIRPSATLIRSRLLTQPGKRAAIRAAGQRNIRDSELARLLSESSTNLLGFRF